MKGPLRIILLVSLLTAFLFFALLSSGQHPPAATVDKSTAGDLLLYLDGQPLGSVANTEPLENRFRELKVKVDQRQGNSNVNLGIGGGPLNIGRIVVFPDDPLSADHLGQIWDKIDDFFDYPAYERMAFWSGGDCERFPRRSSTEGGSTFVLSNRPLTSDEQQKIKGNQQCWLDASLITADFSAYSKQLVKSYRTSISSLEITGDGTYILNEQLSNPRNRVSPIANLAHPTFRRKLAAAVVKQRPIAAESLKNEVNSWIEKRIAEGSEDLVWDESGRAVLPIIINKKAPYLSLSKLLQLINRSEIRVSVIVDGSVKD